jgi:hypothetical protein
MMVEKFWLVGPITTPLKNDGVKVSWDHEIPNIWTNNPNVPNHQPVMVLISLKSYVSKWFNLFLTSQHAVENRSSGQHWRAHQLYR